MLSIGTDKMGTDKIKIRGKKFNPSNIGEKSARAAHVFQLLGTDHPQNITLILEQAQLIMDGIFAFFIPICSQKGCPPHPHKPRSSPGLRDRLYSG